MNTFLDRALAVLAQIESIPDDGIVSINISGTWVSEPQTVCLTRECFEEVTARLGLAIVKGPVTGEGWARASHWYADVGALRLSTVHFPPVGAAP